MTRSILANIHHALFDKNGLLLLGLMTAILTISTVDWALWKITLNRFAAKETKTAYTFFVLQIYSVLMLILSFIALIIGKYVMGTIGEKEKRFPQQKFFILSIFDTASSMSASMSAPYVAGHLQTLISQAVLPLIMVASIFVLNAKYTFYQVIGAGAVLTGATIAAVPGINSADISGRATRGWALILYTVSLLPLSVSYAYRELIFKPAGHNEEEQMLKEIEREAEIKGLVDERSSDVETSDDSTISEAPLLAQAIFHSPSVSSDHPYDDQYQKSLLETPLVNSNPLSDHNDDASRHEQPDFFYMMFWTFLYQFFLSLLAFPILTLEIFGGVAWKDIPLQFSEGMKCFMGHHVKDLECEIGIAPGLILSTYIAFNFCLCIIRLMLIKHGSALLLQITNALALLFSNIVFSWKFIMGQYQEKFNKWDVLGLLGVMIGFIVFQVGVYYKREARERQKQILRQQRGLGINHEPIPLSSRD